MTRRFLALWTSTRKLTGKCRSKVCTGSSIIAKRFLTKVSSVLKHLAEESPYRIGWHSRASTSPTDMAKRKRNARRQFGACSNSASRSAPARMQHEYPATTRICRSIGWLPDGLWEDCNSIQKRIGWTAVKLYGFTPWVAPGSPPKKTKKELSSRDNWQTWRCSRPITSQFQNRILRALSRC